MAVHCSDPLRSFVSLRRVFLFLTSTELTDRVGKLAEIAERNAIVRRLSYCHDFCLKRGKLRNEDIRIATVKGYSRTVEGDSDPM